MQTFQRKYYQWLKSNAVEFEIFLKWTQKYHEYPTEMTNIHQQQTKNRKACGEFYHDKITSSQKNVTCINIPASYCKWNESRQMNAAVATASSISSISSSE